MQIIPLSAGGARLSAQCTDARVNLITPKLFERYPDAEALSRADVAELEEIIKSCGLYKIKRCGFDWYHEMLVEQFDSVIPDTIEQPYKVLGIGRKTANLIVGDVYEAGSGGRYSLYKAVQQAGVCGHQRPAAEMRTRSFRARGVNAFATAWCTTAGRFAPPAPKCQECGLSGIACIKTVNNLPIITTNMEFIKWHCIIKRRGCK